MNIHNTISSLQLLLWARDELGAEVEAALAAAADGDLMPLDDCALDALGLLAMYCAIRGSELEPSVAAYVEAQQKRGRKPFPWRDALLELISAAAAQGPDNMQVRAALGHSKQDRFRDEAIRLLKPLLSPRA